MSLPPPLEKLIRKTPIESLVRKFLRKAGFDIIKAPIPEVGILSNYGINLILDVGANIGQYAMRKRRLSYTGKIVSFEPVSSAFTQLTKNAASDQLWQTVNAGLSNYDGEAVINVSELSVFSSILNQSPVLEECSEAKYVGQETIKVHQLDSIFSKYYQPGDKVFLKIDTQGYEKNVLEGSKSSLKYIKGIQLEVSFFTELYEGELLLIDMMNFLSEQGFTMVLLEPLNHNLISGNLFQGDATFVRLN